MARQSAEGAEKSFWGLPSRPSPAAIPIAARCAWPQAEKAPLLMQRVADDGYSRA